MFTDPTQTTWASSSTSNPSGRSNLTAEAIELAFKKITEVPKAPPQYLIIQSHLMIEQFRFPRSKKRRTRKKWARRTENWRPHRKAMVDMINHIIHVHPAQAKALVCSLRRSGHRLVE